MPEFPGGFNALKTFIENKLKYPIVALENKIIGKVFCEVCGQQRRRYF